MNNDEDKSAIPSANQQGNATDDKAHYESQSTAHQEAPEQSVNKEESNETMNEPTPEKTWHNKNVLKRGVAMLAYGFVAGFVRLGITVIAVFQFISLLFAEKPNQPLIEFGQNLNTYLYQINQFLTVNAEMYPFPFAEWPDTTHK
jgi:hypothetical protein